MLLLKTINHKKTAHCTSCTELSVWCTGSSVKSQISELVSLEHHWTSQRFVSLVSSSELMGWVCAADVFNFAFIRLHLNYQSHGPQPCTWFLLSNETEMRQTAGIYGSLDAHATRKRSHHGKCKNKHSSICIKIDYTQMHFSCYAQTQIQNNTFYIKSKTLWSWKL